MIICEKDLKVKVTNECGEIIWLLWVELCPPPLPKDKLYS